MRHSRSGPCARVPVSARARLPGSLRSHRGNRLARSRITAPCSRAGTVPVDAADAGGDRGPPARGLGTKGGRFTTGGRGRIRFPARPAPQRRVSMQELEKIWMNGELIDWADAKVHVGTHGLHYGSGVFEGIRAYETSKGTAVFRLTDHLQRLQNSAQLLNMGLPYTVDELRAASMELIGANGMPECYLRPIAFFGYGELGVAATGNPVDVVIMSWPWGTYLGAEGLTKGIRAKISSWTRVGPNVIPHVAKATGIYLNSMLAVMEANRAGYDEAILLTDDGFIADGSGENIFIVKNGTIYTPDLSASILPGITRDTIIQIAQDLGYTVVEKQLIRTDLYLADEVFMTGTAAEVTPLREVDDQPIGPPGPVTLAIQKAYLDTVRGHSERWAHWLEYASIEPAKAQA